MLWKRIVVNPQERVLFARNQRFGGILLPGEHRLFVLPGTSLTIERHDIRNLVFRSAWSRYLLAERPAIVEQYFTRVQTNRSQVGMVYVDGELFRVLTPAKSLLFWRGQATVTIETVEVLPELELSADLFENLSRR